LAAAPFQGAKGDDLNVALYGAYPVCQWSQLLPGVSCAGRRAQRRDGGAMNTSGNYILNRGETYQRSPHRIVCAANSYKVSFDREFVIPSARHFDKRMHAIINLIGFGPRNHDQGFIDQHGEFYTREEAWKIAEANGQIV